MKISHMVKREDFYSICLRTLTRYFDGCAGKTKMFVYPALNAIVTRYPSRAVKRYLYSEYRLDPYTLKGLAAYSYVRLMLNCGGLFASRSMVLPASVCDDTLIYPCNRKIRVFDFFAGTVSVVVKEGFPCDALEHEIRFRIEHRADFILPISSVIPGGYTEAIIDGYPLARAVRRRDELTKKALSLWRDYVMPYREEVAVCDYSAQLRDTVSLLCSQLRNCKPGVDFQLLSEVVGQRFNLLRNCADAVSVSLSHGDLQPGNIWVENGSEQIYIIDWESWDRRSVLYDEAVLLGGLRRPYGIARYAESSAPQDLVVVLEDLVFRLVELKHLPFDYGSKEFNWYLQSIFRGGQ